jgi:hypothetical protein
MIRVSHSRADSADFPTVHLRQIDVEYHQAVGALLSEVQSVDTVVGTVDDEAALAEPLVQVVGGLGFILYN